MTLPEQLKNWRTTKGYSQAQAAKKLGISVRTLQQWEQGARKPQGLALVTLNQIFQKGAK